MRRKRKWTTCGVIYLVPLFLINLVDCSATQSGNNTLNIGYNGILEYYPDYVVEEITSRKPVVVKGIKNVTLLSSPSSKKRKSTTESQRLTKPQGKKAEATTPSTTESQRLTRPPPTVFYEETITYKIENVTSANDNFGLLAAAAYNFQGSYVCSPIGSMIPLAILYLLGPTNEVSLNQFKAALVEYEPVKVVEYYSSLLPDLNTKQQHCYIDLAGQVFLAEKYEFVYEGDFVKNVEQAFGTMPEFIDFEVKEDAAYDINTWITNVTDNYIGNIFREKDIHPDTEVFILSVLYIQVSWKRKFDIVRRQIFYGKDIKKIIMMRIPYYEGLKYGDTSEAQLLELPINDDMHMLIVLPKKRGGLHDLMNCYGNNTEWLVGDVRNSMFTLRAGIDVTIPRFRISSLKFDVKNIYRYGLKMDSIFSKTGQKYKGLTPNKATVQQAYQAVSIVLVNLGEDRSNSQSEHGVFEFKADHPFYFVVYNVDLEVASGMFLGYK